MFKNNQALNRSLRAFAFVFIFSSCAPKITSFSASPETITNDDSVILNWKIKGKPTLMFNQRKISNPGNDSLHVLEFTLSVKKGKKEKHIIRQISVLGNESADNVVLLTNHLKGDTLIASGIKDIGLWSNFEIISVSLSSKRTLIVLHDNKKGVLKTSEIPSKVWQGCNYSGLWEIMTILTEEEKKDSSIIPDDLEIKVLIRPLKK